jgi:chitinase
VTAESGTDYVATSSTVTFMPGETSKPANVTVNGDDDGEPTETFALNLTNPTNVTLAASSATGTILNDDGAALYFSISDAAVEDEGNSLTKDYVFTVSCTGTGGGSVDYATSNITATAPSDFTAKSGTLTFANCAASQTIIVKVNGDTTFEPTETFSVDLSNASVNTAIADSQGIGTITNDELEGNTKCESKIRKTTTRANLETLRSKAKVLKK